MENMKAYCVRTVNAKKTKNITNMREKVQLELKPWLHQYKNNN